MDGWITFPVAMSKTSAIFEKLQIKWETNSVESKKQETSDVTKPEVGQIIAFKSSTFNISGTNGFVKLKIDEKVAHGTLSIIVKFYRYNYWG